MIVATNELGELPRPVSMADGGFDPLHSGHVRYLREIHEDTPVRVRFQLIDYDAKRMHYFEELVHASEGWLSATSENMTLHIDMAAKKVTPWPAEVMDRFARVKATHSRLPLPQGVGRRIAMPGKAQ